MKEFSNFENIKTFNDNYNNSMEWKFCSHFLDDLVLFQIILYLLAKHWPLQLPTRCPSLSSLSLLSSQLLCLFSPNLNFSLKMLHIVLRYYFSVLYIVEEEWNLQGIYETLKHYVYKTIHFFWGKRSMHYRNNSNFYTSSCFNPILKGGSRL